MALLASDFTTQNGSLVAVEGSTDSVSLQLRLLPQSPNILVIPEQLQPAPQSADVPFDARLYILQLHRILADRKELATIFLDSCPQGQQRLVFINGGSVGAKALAIQQISANATGDIQAAEALFDEIIKGGVEGLLRYEQEYNSQKNAQPDIESQYTEVSATSASEDADPTDENASEDQSDVEDNDSASTLTRQSQTDNMSDTEDEREAMSEEAIGNHAVDDDEPSASVAQSSAVKEPEPSYAPPEISPSQFPFTPRVVKEPYGLTLQVLEEPDDDPYLTPKTRSVLISRRKRTTFGGVSPTESSVYDDDDNGDHLGRIVPTSIYASPMGERLVSPSTPGDVELGEACAVDVQLRRRPTWVKKVKSLDRFDFSPSKFQSEVPPLRQSFSLQCLTGRRSLIMRRGSVDVGSNGAVTLRRSLMVRASQTYIKRSPTRVGRPLSSNSYVDRGTSPSSIIEAEVDRDANEEQGTLPEPVLPLFEDLILCLQDGKQGDVLDRVLEHALLVESEQPELNDIEKDWEEVSPTTPADDDADSPRIDQSSGSETMEVEETDESEAEVEAFDAAQQLRSSTGSSDTRKSSKCASRETVRENSTAGMSTPASTPPPQAVYDIAERLHTITLTGRETVVTAQNILRDTLNARFPPQSLACGQLSESTNLWKPLAFEATGADQTIVDQVIAVGCEASVDRSLFDHVAVQIERLGIQKQGPIRGGMIDVGYLIKNAMQTLSMLPSVSELSELSTHPDILALLLVPQLESYLNCHTSTRLLVMHYSPAQLPVVLALRELLGDSVFKIAAVVEPVVIDPPASLVRPAPRAINPLSNEGVASMNARHRQRGRPEHLAPIKVDAAKPRESTSSIQIVRDEKLDNLFAKSNFILHSTADAVETAIFLANIRSMLVSISPFYTEPPKTPVPTVAPAPPAEPAPTPAKPRKNSLTPSTTSTITAARSSPRGGGGERTPTAPAPPPLPVHKASASVASTATRALSTADSRPGSRKYMNTSEWERRIEKAWDAFSFHGDLDSDDEHDEYVRRLMPTFGRPVRPRKGNTRKALKMLGLA